jgi:hypothetical protein
VSIVAAIADGVNDSSRSLKKRDAGLLTLPSDNQYNQEAEF